MSVEARYQYGMTVFGQWQIQELIRLDPDTNAAFFRLTHRENPNNQCALKVITLMQESLRTVQASASQQQASESRRAQCKDIAIRSAQQLFALQQSPLFAACHEFTFLDWQDSVDTGCDLMMRTELLQDLRSILQTGYVFPEEEARRIGSSLCAALDICHRSQTLHRSIRPENIYFTPEGNCKLGDFVAADLQAAPGVSVLQYWAPESLQHAYYRESDIYSLGLVLYEMCNGSLPFAAAGSSVHEAISTRLQGQPFPQPRQAGPALTAAIHSACAHNPADRYHSAEEFSNALNSIVIPTPVPVFAPAPVAAPAPAPVSAPAPQRSPAAPQPQPTHSRQYDDAPRETDVDSSTGMLILRISVIAVMILLVLGAGIFLYLWMRGNASPSEGDPTQGQSTPATTPETTAATVATTAPTEATEATEPSLPEDHYYYSCYNPYTEFVLPDSNCVFYAPSDLKHFTDKQLEVALAEIYGRYGVTPSDRLLAEYFSYLSWFTPRNEPYTLNQMEEANALLLRTLLKKRDGSIYHSANPYMPYFDADKQFMPEASTRYLTSKDLKGLSKSELSLIRNEIFARHGFIFAADDLLEYFYCTNWYVPTYTSAEFSYNFFSQEETENLDLIVVYEDLLDYHGPRSDNPYIPYQTASGYILPHSGTTRLRTSDLENLDETQLLLAEHEIYARHGLAFEDAHTMHYFLECHWYTPEFGPTRTARIRLSSIEQANLELIRAYRQNH